MSRMLLKVGVVGALLVSALVGASSASANWTTNGSALGVTIAWTAGSWQLTVHSSSGAQGITCATSTEHIDLFSGGASGVNIGKITSHTFTTCSVVGQAAAVKCDTTSTQLNATAYAPATSISTMTVAGFSCVVVKLSGACGNATTFTGGGITVTGTVNATYGNTSQTMTIDTAGQNLRNSWNSTGCLQGTGTGNAAGTWRAAGGGSYSYGVVSFIKPQITN